MKMNRKKFWWLVLLVPMILMSCLTLGGTIGSARGEFEWRQNDGENTVMITGYLGNRTDVQIPSQIQGMPVTHIGDGAFGGPPLTSVTIPDSVTHIGRSAFWLNQLTSVVIPDSVTYIGGGAFADNQLTSVTIGSSVTYIGQNAFWNNQLTSVVIPDSVTLIGGCRNRGGSSVSGAFQRNQLTSVTIGNGVTYIEPNVFRDNQITTVIFGDSVTNIGRSAFENNQLSIVVIPHGVTHIGYGAFRNNQLTDIVIPDSVEYMWRNTFAGNQLASIPIPPQELRASQAHRVEQARLAGLYQQIGHSVGNLAFTAWQSTSGRLMGMITFYNGTFTRGFIYNLNPFQIIETGTFRVTGNTVMLRNSAGVYIEAAIAGYTLRLDNIPFNRTI